MHYTYVLKSLKDGKFYTGFTTDVKKRLEEHNAGQTSSTRHRRPLELMYYEACTAQADALARERFLKSGMGKRYLNNRMKRALAIANGAGVMST